MGRSHVPSAPSQGDGTVKRGKATGGFPEAVPEITGKLY